MDFGVAFWIFVILLITLSMFAGGSSKVAQREQDAPRRVVIETLDKRGQVVKRETATIGPDRAQGAPRERPYDEAARRSDLAQFERMKTR